MAHADIMHLSTTKMVSTDIANVAHLDISAREIAQQIPQGRGDWEKCVPSDTAKQIIKHKLFGFPEK